MTKWKRTDSLSYVTADGRFRATPVFRGCASPQGWTVYEQSRIGESVEIGRWNVLTTENTLRQAKEAVERHLFCLTTAP